MVSSVAAVIWLTGDFLLVKRNLSYPAVPYWNAVMQDGVFIYHRPSSIEVRVALLREKEMSRLKSDMLSQIGHLNLAVTSNLDLEDVGKSLLDTIELFFPEWSTMLASIFTMLLEYSFRLESPQKFHRSKSQSCSQHDRRLRRIRACPKSRQDILGERSIESYREISKLCKMQMN